MARRQYFYQRAATPRIGRIETDGRRSVFGATPLGEIDGCTCLSDEIIDRIRRSGTFTQQQE